jgi:predicted AlkP superfamily pyrophosphatase or phosphodiesterase
MRAARLNLISGLLSQAKSGGNISLQYADDTLLFLENDLDKAANLKWLLVYFEQLSGMKINYDKSDLLVVGVDEDRANEFARIFCYKRSFLLSI